MAKRNIYIEARNRSLEHVTRRHFLKECRTGIGMMALGSFISGCDWWGDKKSIAGGSASLIDPLIPKAPHFAPKARAVIYLHMAGAPSQLELFDYKPELVKLNGQDCPASFLEGKRFAFIRGVPKLLGPVAEFRQFGESGTWLSDRLPHFSTMVDEVSILKAVTTDQFNHAPAQLLMHTGSARLGRPSIPGWPADRSRGGARRALATRCSRKS